MRLFLVFPFLAGLVASLPSQIHQQPFGLMDEHQSSKVNVSLYVMSRCPDARLCEDVFDSVINKEGILDKIDLNIGYIGTPKKSEVLGVTCKHGLEECIGNAQQLCLLNHLPIDKSYSIIQCQNYPSSFPRDIGNLDSLKKCVDTVGGVDWEKSGLAKCIEGKSHSTTITNNDDKEDKEKIKHLGKEAKKLLKKNINQTYEKEIKTSCTIDIDSTISGKQGRRRCIVDGGIWKGCDDGHTAQDFIRVIEEEHKNLQSKKDD
ncbi:uncharacterized protein L201_001346 [Kwoniella dendrophila CBS 6074]|uniref:Gamma interferon inducible lysosomal thiol reductase GILT n=1 Tax=Kwoniella dendrophila CBS 6074 TaxID=1295534 RepID=A0AAX4JP00_9TREE